MQKNSVFIIEDDPTMVGLLQTLLNLEGFDTAAYHSGSDISVYDQITRAQPDVIFLDVNLRDLNGLEVIQELKKSPQLSSIPVIMTSGTDYRDLCIRYGAINFILKPYMPDDLIHMLKTIQVKE